MSQTISDKPMSLPAEWAAPALAVGCMRWGSWGAQMDVKAMRTLVEGCLQLGLTLFDHADIYGHYSTEADFGSVLREAPALREQMQLISKCGIRMVSDNRPQHQIKSYDCGREHILQSVDQSLRDLHTDRLDVLLLHRPDILLNPQEVAETFYALRQAGKVLHFGVSNFTVSQVRALRSVFPDLLFNQVEISPLHRNAFEDGTLDTCLEFGLRPMAWSPLAGGKLGQSAELQQVLGQLSGVYGVSAETLVYAWLLRHPAGIIPVTGTTRLERLAEVAAARQVTLTREDWYLIWTACAGEVA